jgi:hypothetical protein
MRALQRQHIVDVFVLVDDHLPKQTKPGAHSVLTDSELLTILIWNGLTEPHKNLSAVYGWIEREYADYPVTKTLWHTSIGCCRKWYGS